MSPIAIQILNFLMSLSLLIVLHELGHMIPAKLFGTRVEKFFLFFDVKFALFKKKIGETVYGIGWLPLGGYVKISGMIDESMDKEQMKQAPKPYEFRSKPAWQRLIIMLGGVTVNILLGFFIYGMLTYTYGEPKLHGDDTKYGFGYTKTLEDIGFQQGDKVMLVDGDTLQDATMLIRHLMLRSPETVTILRDGNKVTVDIPEDIGDRIFAAGDPVSLSPRFPFMVKEVTEGSVADSIGIEEGTTIQSVAGMPIEFQTDLHFALNNRVERGEPFNIVYTKEGKTYTRQAVLEPEKDLILGIMMEATDDSFANISRIEYGFGESLLKGVERGYWTMHDYVAQLGFIFSEKGASQLGGFVTIGKLYSTSFDWAQFWSTTAVISFILAIMNLLPIPALDGGHVMFLTYEMITGREPNEKFMEIAQTVGIILLLALMLYANGNDIYRLIFE